MEQAAGEAATPNSEGLSPKPRAVLGLRVPEKGNEEGNEALKPRARAQAPNTPNPSSSTLNPPSLSQSPTLPLSLSLFPFLSLSLSTSKTPVYHLQLCLHLPTHVYLHLYLHG